MNGNVRLALAILFMALAIVAAKIPVSFYARIASYLAG